jgi:hypothetical protein
MYKFITICAAVLFAGSMAVASTSPDFTPTVPIVTDQGGPDAFGYRWIDNDSAGGPAYTWVDITGNGTQVQGLADDNNVGPISLGIQFPYYWYTVNRCWIGSNGYISFSSNANYAHPFSSIPSAGNPNDLVAVLVGDLDFTRGGSCYYYSNSVDSFVVSWIDVPPYSNDGSLNDSTHTFQLILCVDDSSLTFQYGENHGNFNEQGNLADVIGMENVNGQVGLEYLEDNLPANRMWHDGLATRYYPIPDPGFVVHDFGLVDVMQEGSGAIFVHDDSTIGVRALVKNFGNQVETTMRTSCIIRRGTTIVYHDTVDVSTLNPGEQVWIEFPDPFIPAEVAVYRAAFATIMTGDQNSTNNSMNHEIDSYLLPQYLNYTDNLAETNRSWNGDFSGFGVEFQVPEPVRIDSGSFYVYSVTASGPAYIWIYPDDGSGPDMDNILAGDTVDVTALGWYTIDFSGADLNFFSNDKFYMVVLHAFVSTFTFGMDQTAPLSNRGWEYTGGLAPDRDRSLSDIMFKVYATAPIPGIIQGTVSDGTNPLESVIVSAYDDADALAAIDTSDAAGAYSVSLYAGTYREVFEKVGFDDLEITGIVVEWDSITIVNAVMVEQSGCAYIPGNINGVAPANGIDVTFGVSYLKGGAVPPNTCPMCPQPHPFYAAMDVNGSCTTNGIDITYFVGFLKGGPPLLYCATCPPVGR